jgi:hypothetical protein
MTWTILKDEMRGVAEKRLELQLLEAKRSTAQFFSGIATGRMGEPVAPRNLMQAPKKTYS